MKRLGIIVILLSFFVSWYACGYCGGGGKADSRNSAQDDRLTEAYHKFLKATKKLRQELAGKEAEYSAAMYQWNPNPDLVGQLAKEIAALQDEIEEKARAYGLPGPVFYQQPVSGYGYGPRWGYRPWCYGGRYWAAPPQPPSRTVWGNYGPEITSRKAYHDFLRDTKKLRQELASKEAEFNAVMYQYNPNPELVGQLAKEIAELNDLIEEKARAHGLPAPVPHYQSQGAPGYGRGWGGARW